MSDIVLNANAVGQIITYMAPGYLTYLGYRLRYPGPDRPAGQVLIIAVAISLPLVAIASQMHVAHKASDLLYMVILLGGAMLIGYSSALLRGRQWFKTAVAKLGYRMEPESSIYAQTLSQMSDQGVVQIELKDGRRITGCPRNGPQYKDDGINELYLVYPETIHDDGHSAPVPGGAGIVVPLTEIANIVLGEDPTGAPPAPEASPDDARVAALA